MRKNRRDPKNELHDRVWENPVGFTRETRRSVGYRQPVSLLTEMHDGLEVDQDTGLPRFVRRHGIEAIGGSRIKRRVRKWRSRVQRALRPYNMQIT